MRSILWLAGLLLLPLLGGCARDAGISVPEGLTLNRQATADALEEAGDLHAAERLSARRLCALEQSAVLAEGLVNDGWRAWLQGDEAAARGHLRDARDALAGTSAVASYLIARNCAAGSDG